MLLLEGMLLGVVGTALRAKRSEVSSK